MSSATPLELPDPARSQAVLIGTSMGRREHDKQAERGLRHLREALCDKHIWGLPDKNCHLLINAATAEDVVNYCLAAASRVGSNGSLLLYFIGHSETDYEGFLHLGVDRTAPTRTLSMQRVTQFLEEEKSLNVTVILDCSHAGAATRSGLSPNIALLGATEAHTLAAIHPDEPYTTFTGNLLWLLRNGIDDGPEILTLSDIHHELASMLAPNHHPRPVLSFSQHAPSRPLVRNTARHPSTKRTTRGPIELGIKPTPTRRTPTYIPRQHDRALRAYLLDTASSSGQLIVLVGDPNTGKTRSANEAVNAALPSRKVIIAPHPEVLGDLADFTYVDEQAVIWLDDIGAYLPPHGSPDVLEHRLRTLADRGLRSPVIATATTETWAKLAAAGGSSVMSAIVVAVEASFNDEEMARAAEIANTDPQIAEALDNVQGNRVIQALMGEELPRPVTWELRTRGYGDRPPTTDLLHRDAMIGALTDLISPITTEDDDKSGPTVIALDGAWGIGKTSLVDLVVRELKSTPRPTLQATKAKPLKVHEADRALSGHGDPLWTKEMMPRADPASGDPPLITAHFEPWAHQTSEQVWAGLTTTLLGAVEKTLLPHQTPATGRYWFQRNLDRVDRMRLRRALRKSCLSPLLAVSVLALAIPVVAQMARSTDTYRLFDWVIAGSNIALLIAGIAFITGVGHSIWRYRTRPAADFLPAELFVGPVPSGATDDTIRDPYHNARSGQLYLAQHDVFAVLDDVRRSGHHMVVFIDDLDRCTPRTTAEVFEAINLFVTRTFPVTRFVLCLDATTVAAHLDEVYGALKGKPLHGDDPSPGWSFLRKLIQLPITIPPIAADSIDGLLNSLLGEVVQQPLPARPTTQTPANGLRKITTEPQVLAASPASLLATSMVNAVAEVLEHDEDIRKLLAERLKEQSGLSVRETKRILTIWQYYVRVLIRLDPGNLAEHARHLVILAEIIARWPAAQRAVHRRFDGNHGLTLLASADGDWEWAKAVRRVGLDHKCADGIRALLDRYDGERVASVAERLT
ncbi:P-loop NTPase fold protein [Kibdelosporangium aridum]|uniref:P-loop NTPase fold protein n=1 Tax=Kibdelosporangium aridum TaxID=2030 RepID=UPI0035EA94DA